jgi:SAM-dependent methyltransferase
LDEILSHLPADARVLDLGCRDGSFAAAEYPFLTVRVDAERKGHLPNFVQADSVHLPFRSSSFDAVILNHVLEHLTQLKPSLQEIGRVVKKTGAVFVSVPDATTLSDRLYRKVFLNRGGHVNLFGSAKDIEKSLAWYFGLPHVATRTLHTSFNFLNRANTRGTRRQMRFGGFPEPILVLTNAMTRLIDRWFSTRTSVYGWAFYFGTVGETVDTKPLVNVCVRCGQGYPQMLRCPNCNTRNVLF